MFCNDWQAYCPFKPRSDPVRWEAVGSGDCPPRPTRIPLFSSLTLSQEVSQQQQPGGCSSSSSSGSSSSDAYDGLVLNAGGPIWALDWCPQPSPDKKHYVAVSAHPAGASTHRMGEPVLGKNLIQLWAVGLPSSSSSSSYHHHHHRHRHHAVNEDVVGRSFLAADNQQQQQAPLPQDSAQQLVLVSCSREEDDDAEEDDMGESARRPWSSSKRMRKGAPSSGATRQHVGSRAMGREEGEEEEEEEGSGVRLEVGAVRMTLGLAHDAGLAWDLKWRPTSGGGGTGGGGGGLGQLAVALGDASVCVFDVPDPASATVAEARATAAAHHHHHDASAAAGGSAAAATAPVVVRIRPSFVGAVVVGDNHMGTGAGEASPSPSSPSLAAPRSRSSMPLALQWCPSPPHNRLIVVCHDGTAALFLVPHHHHHQRPRGEGSAEEGSRSERPLVQFTVNSMPLRAVAWAPPGCGREVEENVVAISGNGQRIYLWDLRDPFQAIASVVLGGELVTQLAWMQRPRSLIAATDDGNIRVLCLDREVMATEEQPVGAVAPYRSGIAHYGCHGSPLWDLSLSHHFGLVAYGGVDGQVLWFQINPEPLMKGKNPSRDKVPHTLCGGFALDSSEASPNGERCIVLVRGKVLQQGRSRMPNSNSNPLAAAAAGGGQEAGQAPQSAPAAANGSQISASYSSLPDGARPPHFHVVEAGGGGGGGEGWAWGEEKSSGGGGVGGEGCGRWGSTSSSGGMRGGVEESVLRFKKHNRSYRSAVEMAAMADTPFTSKEPLCPETAVHRVAWGPTAWKEGRGMVWLAYGGKAGLLRCQVVANLCRK